MHDCVGVVQDDATGHGWAQQPGWRRLTSGTAWGRKEDTVLPGSCQKERQKERQQEGETALRACGGEAVLPMMVYHYLYPDP